MTTIRKLNRKDLEASAKVFYKSFNSVGEKWDLPTCLKRLEQYFNEESCWAAEDEDKLIGVLTAKVDNVTDHQELYIDILAVDPDYHKSGTGSLLMSTAKKYAKDMGYKGIWLSASTELPSYQWYLKTGFVETTWKALYQEI